MSIQTVYIDSYRRNMRRSLFILISRLTIDLSRDVNCIHSNFATSNGGRQDFRFSPHFLVNFIQIIKSKVLGNNRNHAGRIVSILKLDQLRNDISLVAIFGTCLLPLCLERPTYASTLNLKFQPFKLGNMLQSVS